MAGAGTGTLLQVGLVLLALVAVLSLVARRVTARGTGRGRGKARTLVSLTPQHSLHEVEIDGRRLIVGTGPGGAPRLVYELPPRQGGAVRALSVTGIPGARDG